MKDIGSIELDTYPMLNALNQTKKLSVTMDLRYISTEQVIDYAYDRWAKKNPLVEFVTIDETNWNVNFDINALKKANPEVMLANLDVIENYGKQFPRLMYWGSGDEESPTARAEWIEIIGLLTGTEDYAEAIDKNITSRYNEIKSRIPVNATKPVIFLGESFNFTDPRNHTRVTGWRVPGGKSYHALIVKDAGGNYVFADNPNTTYIFLNYSRGLELLKKSDYWIQPNVCFKRVEEFLGWNKDLGDCKVVQWSNILMANRRADDDLCLKNDVYETGNLFPDLVLLDLGKLLYPHKVFEWYKTQFFTHVLPLSPASTVDYNNKNTYPVNCAYKGWGKWSECTAKCDIGTQWRFRDISQMPKRGGMRCNQLFDIKECFGPCSASFNLTVLIICVVVIAVVVAIVLAWFCGRYTAKKVGNTLAGLHDDERAVVIENLAAGNYQTLA